MLQRLRPDPLFSGDGVAGAISFGPTQGQTTDNFSIFGWIATARDNKTIPSGSNYGSVYDDASRTASNCYIRGLSEKVSFATNNGRSFQWRRVVFAFTGQELIREASSAAYGQLWGSTDTNGYVRATTNLRPVVGNPYGWNQLQSVLFRGVINVDWITPMTAPIDKTRVRLIYDKLRTVVPQTEEGVLKTYKHWHEVNKTLVYNDDEVGGGKIPGIVLSANNRQSVGDIYVIDMFDTGPGATGDDGYQFNIESTLYWHER